MVLTGCKSKEDNLSQEKANTVAIHIPKPIVLERREDELPEVSITIPSEVFEESNRDADDIAAELNIMWGPSPEKGKSNIVSSKKRSIPPVQKKKEKESYKKKDESNFLHVSRKEKVIPQKNNDNAPLLETKKGRKEKPEIVRPNFPKQKPKKRKAQKMLGIISTVKKYTSEKGQKNTLRTELNKLENNADNIDMLIDLKSFFPESFHALINEKIAESVASSRK